MHSRRIFWQIYPSYLLVTLLTLLAGYLLSASSIRQFYHQQTSSSLNVQALFAQVCVRDWFDGEHVAELSQASETLGEKSSARLTFILPDGTVVGDSDKAHVDMGNHRDRPEIREALAGRTGQSVRYSNTLSKNMMYVAVPVWRHNHVVGVVRTSRPLTELDQLIAAGQRRMIAGGLVILILAAVFSLVVSRRISRPLERIKRGAARYAAGDFSHRLQATGSAEIGSLAETMNAMATQLEERLQTVSKERNQREAVLSSMVEGVLAVDTEGQIISMNTAAARFFNVIQPKTAPGRSIEEVFRNVKLQQFVGELLEGQETCECDLTVQNQHPCYLQARGTNLLGVQGRRIGAVVVFNDVSRLRRLENIRRDFVANVSHELKTPITAIKGFVETLLEGAIREPLEAERFLKIVAKHADRLNAIIEDLLTLSRLEQEGQAGVEMRLATLAELLRSAVEVCAHRSAKKKTTVEIVCAEDLQAVINPPLIEQALINLIGNALKYSSDGKVIQINAIQEDADIVLSVVDQGYGIAPEHLERLFERFYRVDRGRSRQEGGTGLGLAIVKHIAQVHGGTVSVKSTLGQGSTFKIVLPMAR